MYCCVAYDISGNRLRLRVSKWCRQAGLVRLQKSLFIGRLAIQHLEELEKRVRPLVSKTDKFAIIPLEADSYAAVVREGMPALARQLDKTLVLNVF